MYFSALVRSFVFTWKWRIRLDFCENKFVLIVSWISWNNFTVYAVAKSWKLGKSLHNKKFHWRIVGLSNAVDHAIFYSMFYVDAVTFCKMLISKCCGYLLALWWKQAMPTFVLELGWWHYYYFIVQIIHVTIFILNGFIYSMADRMNKLLFSHSVRYWDSYHNLDYSQIEYGHMKK